TSPDMSGHNVNPQRVNNYDGSVITLNEEKGFYLDPAEFPEMLQYVGQDLITTDGTTLLGADD
ncbi:MAG TPA: peptidase T, partial [Porphyromonadaceae bacterium]|nr:peptidase T [Porphyromonadaceae bacterium]